MPRTLYNYRHVVKSPDVIRFSVQTERRRVVRARKRQAPPPGGRGGACGRRPADARRAGRDASTCGSAANSNSQSAHAEGLHAREAGSDRALGVRVVGPGLAEQLADAVEGLVELAGAVLPLPVELGEPLLRCAGP